MFCSEPIIAAYSGQRNEDFYVHSFFDCYHDMAYHMTCDYRLVLETEHYYLSLSVEGVKKEEKTCSVKEYQDPEERIDPFIHSELLLDGEPPYVDYESTLFVGERLLDVTQKDDCFFLRFDDFDLKIIPHESGKTDMPSLENNNDWAYHRVHGCERLLQKKCDCGGTGELFLDFVTDYVVRCNLCKRSTWAEMCAIDAIENWNAGEIHCDLSNIVVE